MSTSVERRRLKNDWTHDELVADLAAWLDADGFVCGECRFGRAWYENAPIPDVLKIRKSYTRWDVQIYECKARRDDFLGELRNGKWRTYLPMSSRLYFATPYHTVVKDETEIPEGVGWIIRGPQGWKVKQVPKIREFKPEPEQMLALLMNYDDRLRDVKAKYEALKKVKHRHNVVRNEAMLKRLERFEAGIQQAAHIRANLRRAAETFKDVTGYDPADRNWIYELRRKLEMAHNGVGTDSLKHIRHNLKRMVDYVDALLPEEKSQ